MDSFADRGDPMWPELRPGPLYVIEVDRATLAELTDPAWRDMFWCEYTLRPTDDESDAALHDPNLWNDVLFAVRHVRTQTIAENCFSGGFDLYCQRETDRLTFRSLWPRYEDELSPPGVISRLLDRFWR
ncbi:hypothetical protein Poly21_52530 [Allorhodopirellula heiligendammensis]|uniref:Uncharacterized protein n=1 Tax=Allorhodopirellula heiligendammensis TaxID=2714739 RepID=A0A5C6BCH7_9BACT|nr:hypothetical protein Poly21_52530 [Allorhodopirellula heiligendammensis]